MLLMNNNILSLDPVPVNQQYGALPSYATPGVTFMPQWDVAGQGINRTSLNTPLGYPVTTPQKFGAMNQSYAFPPGTPVPHLFPGVVPIIVGSVFKVATTAVRAAVVHPPFVAST